VRVALALCAALVAAGCGGDGVTRGEWAGEADAICAKYERRLESLGTAEALPELARLLDRAIGLLEDEHRELSALEAPEGDEERVRRLLAHVQGTITAGKKARDAARRGDEQAVAVAIGESESTAAQARHVARDLGARTCAEP
jgi:hypothetical protein